MPIRELLSGFTYGERFARAAAEAAEEAGWNAASTAVVFFGIKYTAGLCNNELAPLTFIGNFKAVIPEEF